MGMDPSSVKRPKLKEHEIIDLTLIEDSENDVPPNDVGKFNSGTVRMIQSHNAELDPDKLSFDDIVITSGLQSCFLSAYVADMDFLFEKLSVVPRVVLSLDKSQGIAGNFPKWKSLQVVLPEFPRFPSYGVMHSKIMLLFYDQWLRLVISSANLMDYDYELVQNIVFVQDFPKSRTGPLPATSYAQASPVGPFRKELDHILRLLKLPTDFYIDNYNFSTVEVKLVYSTPGITSIGPATTGLTMLSRQIHHSLPGGDDSAFVEALGSSLGVLDNGWLSDFWTCCQGRLPAVISPERDRLNNFRIIFPTSEYAMNDPGVFRTIFCQSKNWQKYPKKMFYHCKSSFGTNQPLHAKMLVAFDERCQPIWFYIGSSNFTPSAWGKFVKEKRQIMIANYELGVLFTADLAQKLCPASFPFPYQRPPEPYTENDLPWCQEVLFK